MHSPGTQQSESLDVPGVGSDQGSVEPCGPGGSVHSPGTQHPASLGAPCIVVDLEPVAGAGACSVKRKHVLVNF